MRARSSAAASRFSPGSTNSWGGSKRVVTSSMTGSSAVTISAVTRETPGSSFAALGGVGGELRTDDEQLALEPDEQLVELRAPFLVGPGRGRARRRPRRRRRTPPDRRVSFVDPSAVEQPGRAVVTGARVHLPGRVGVMRRSVEDASEYAVGRCPSPPSGRHRRPEPRRRRPAAGLRSPAACCATARPKQWVKNVLVFAAPGAAGVLTEPDQLAAHAGRVRRVLPRRERHVLPERRARRRGRPPAPDQAQPSRSRPAARQRPALAKVMAVVLDRGWRLAIVGAAERRAARARRRRRTSSSPCRTALWLKHEPVVDLGCVAAGFVLRAIAGGVATDVPLSDWFLIVAGAGSLFMVDRQAPRRAGRARRRVGRPPQHARRVLGLGFLNYVRAVTSGRRDHRVLPVGVRARRRGRRHVLVPALDRPVRARHPAVRARRRAGRRRRARGDRARATACSSCSACCGWRPSPSASMPADPRRRRAPTAADRAGVAPRPPPPPSSRPTTADDVDDVARPTPGRRGVDRPRPRPQLRRRGPERRRLGARRHLARPASSTSTRRERRRSASRRA